MLKRFQNLSFKSKIIWLFLVILVLNTAVTGSLYYTHLSRDTVSNYERSSEDLVRQIVIHLDGRFGSILQKTGTFTNNMSFVTPMKSFLNNSEQEYDPVLAGKIAETITEIRTGDDLISSMYVCTPKGIFGDYSLIRRREVLFEDTDMYRHFVYHPSDTVAWFSARENELYQEAGRVIPLVYKQKISNRNIYFVINISQAKVADYLGQTFNSYDCIFIVDDDTTNIANYEARYAVVLEEFSGLKLTRDEALCRQVQVNGKKYLATCALMSGSGWKICALTSIRSLTAGLQSLRLFIVAEMFLSAVLCFLLVVLFSRRLTKPLEQLAETMEHAVGEEFHETFSYPYRDEIGMLGNRYNDMLREISELVQDLNIHIEALKEEKEHVKVIQKLKRQAELQALQAQINPHFLYNTLNLITWQAVAQGAEEISIISTALGKYFRISLSRGQEIISVHDEIEHVRNYLDIQKIRYKHQLSYEIAVPKEFFGSSIPKLVLQPLVENALYHGIKDKDMQGTIWIRAGQKTLVDGQEYLEFYVEDDGIGIPREQLELLNYRLEHYLVDSESGYGIYNVNNRIELYYGAGFGLHLESEAGKGTRSILRLPWNKEAITD